MKKALSLIISLILVFTALLPLANVSAAEHPNKAWLESQPDGTIVFTPDFRGEVGVYEPNVFMGNPEVTVDPTNPNSFVLQTSVNASKHFWGGFIETLPLDETTCYTIYYTLTRTGKHSIGVYCDSVYGTYGYPERSKLMNVGSSLAGHDYVNYAENNLNAPELVEGGSVTQEFALEVNGINSKIAAYIKNNQGEYVLIDESLDGDIAFFNADILGLFFYVYYSGHVTTVSDVYIAKGLAFGTAVIPETTEAPDAPEATKAPETPDTTKAPEKSGCSSTVASGAILAIIGCAVPALLRKKRR